MKIHWTYIVNTKDEKKIQSILDEILVNHSETYGINKEIYWKDNSKYYITFHTAINAIDLNLLMTGLLHEISYQWNFTLSDSISEINAFTDKPRNFKISWVSFSIEAIQ